MTSPPAAVDRPADHDEQRAEHAEQDGGLQPVAHAMHVRSTSALAAAFPSVAGDIALVDSPSHVGRSTTSSTRTRTTSRLSRAAPAASQAAAGRLACMDSRLDLFGALGLDIGDAHLIRNAGGIPTADALRSLALSQRALGTREITIIHHTECGMDGFDDEAFRAELERGDRARRRRGGYTRIHRPLRGHPPVGADGAGLPWLPYRDEVRGFVFDVGYSRHHRSDLRRDERARIKPRGALAPSGLRSEPGPARARNERACGSELEMAPSERRDEPVAAASDRDPSSRIGSARGQTEIRIAG